VAFIGRASVFGEHRERRAFDTWSPSMHFFGGTAEYCIQWDDMSIIPVAFWLTASVQTIYIKVNYKARDKYLIVENGRELPNPFATLSLARQYLERKSREDLSHTAHSLIAILPAPHWQSAVNTLRPKIKKLCPLS
jgi:hypothetical protein